MSSVVLADSFAVFLLRLRDTTSPVNHLSQVRLRNHPKLLTTSSANIVCLANGKPGIDGKRVFGGGRGGVQRTGSVLQVS